MTTFATWLTLISSTGQNGVGQEDNIAATKPTIVEFEVQPDRIRPIITLHRRRMPVRGNPQSVETYDNKPSMAALLAFDFAFPIAYSDSDSRQVFSFTMGLTR